jgi:hypothetical protein
MHRLFAIVGRDRIDREMAEGCQSVMAAVAYLMLEEHGPEQWRQGVELMVESGGCNHHALEDPELFWTAVLGAAMGIDPWTGERTGPPIRDHSPRRARPHGPRRGPFRRR